MAFNPFATLHYHLAGGRNKLLAAVGTYTLVMIIGWYVASRTSLSTFERDHGRPPHAAEITQISSQTSAGTIGWIAGAQALFLLAMAPLAIRKAVVADHTSGMLESHRLTPLSGLQIVFGYLLSAPLLAYCLYGAALLLGAWFTVDAGRSLSMPPNVMLRHWFSGQALLLVFCLLAGSASLLFALHSPGKRGVPIFLFFFFGGGMLIQLVPGLRMLFGLAAGSILMSALQQRAFNFGAAGPTLLTSMAVQVLCATLFIAASARKVRRVASSLFGLTHGILLVLLFGAITAAAIAVEPPVMFGSKSPDMNFLAVQVGASLFVASLLAYAPLTAGAEQQNAAESALSFGERRSTASLSYIGTLPILLALVMSGIVIAAYALCKMPDGMTRVAELTSRVGNGALPVSIWLMLLMDFSIFVLAMRRQRAGTLWVGLAYFAFRIIPLLADGVQSAIAGFEELERLEETGFAQSQPNAFDDDHDPTSRYSDRSNPLSFGQFSPLGTVALSLANRGNPWIGVAFQALITAVFVTLWYRGLPKAVPAARPA